MVEDAFIRAIQADPQEEAPRLIYADWLEEHDNFPAADYLRIETRLAKLPLESPEAPPLRDRLWHAWANVNPRWLLTFTQPRMLRANPTPYPSAWKNFGLGTLRETRGTYGTWPYDSVPTLPVDELRGEFQYLNASRPRGRRAGGGNAARYRRQFEQMLADAAGKGVRLPEAFVAFKRDTAFQSTFRSPTGCGFAFPDEYSPIRASPSGEGMHIHFFCDSQSCLLWDLYVHASGGHCVIARNLEFFNPEPRDPDEYGPPSREPGAWFVAPSFEAFIYRVWVENQIWYIENAAFLRSQGKKPPPITPEIQAYMDHYRNREP
jgi:uncharacterized protein (TIGR02996 family)